MILKVKKFIKLIIDKTRMLPEFLCDYWGYKKYNYNGLRKQTFSSFESMILRQTHIIEKGLSLEKPRVGFGEAKINDLFEMMSNYKNAGFPVDAYVYQHAVQVLFYYMKTQKALGYTNSALFGKIESIINRFSDEVKGSSIINANVIEKTTLNELPLRGDYKDFSESRHSVRQFSSKEIDINDVKKAIKIAQKSPSACNRQATKVYFYANDETNKKIGDLIAGNTGFESAVNKYLVITGNVSSFYDTFERNQLYVEGGIFALALVEALHYYKIGSCILQNGEYHKKNKRFKKICGNIPDNERIILFIAIGYYKDEFTYAVSKRKPLEEIFITN